MFAIAFSPAAAQAPLLYRDTTGGVETGILMTYEQVPGGTIVHSVLTDGDRHDMEIDTSLATKRYHVASPNRKIDYTVTREGDVLVVQGILGGAPVLRRIGISPLPWYQAMERSLHDYLVSGAKGEPTFWIMNPWEAKAYLMQVASEGYQLISVNGRRVSAMTVRLRPTGVFRPFWSALYWYRPDDGFFLRYEAVRGFPGTPLTVIEFMGTD
jgi:hypothetical protein